MSRCCASSTTGLTAIREAEDQQPIRTATRSSWIRRCASRAKVALSERPSAITARTGRPRRPPAALISSIASCSPSSIDSSITDQGPVFEWSSPMTIGVRSGPNSR
jgi:hypothetical protein